MRKGADIRFRVLVCIAVLVCMGIFGTRAVHAQETGRIEILCKGTSMHQKEVVFEGAKFALYQVGNSTENGWELTDEFRRAQVVLNDSSASGQRENAELLWKYAKEQKLKGVNRETDKNGKFVFSNLKEGLYLIGQTERYSAEEGFFAVAPFLVAVPVLEQGMPVYEIEIHPKSEWEEKPETPAENIPTGRPSGTGVVTGDAANPAPYCILALLSMTVILAVEKRK